METTQWRKRAAFVALFGVGSLALNHWMVVNWGEGYPFVVVLAPAFLALGLAGLADPRLLRGIGKYGRDLPARFKLGAWTAAAVGALAGVFLLTSVYHFE